MATPTSDTGSAPRQRARPLDPAERRASIVRAVVPLLLTHGEQVTTRQIAEAAGVAEGTIFRVFDDKETLLVAAAAEVMNPADGRAVLEAALDGVDDLAGRLHVIVTWMDARAADVVSVMGVLRGIWLGRLRRGEDPHGGHTAPAEGGRPRPPTFVVEAHEALVDLVSEVALGPLADELSVSPRRAAVLLRTLVMGSRHPGGSAEDRLTPDEVVAVALHGIRRDPSADTGRGAR